MEDKSVGGGRWKKGNKKSREKESVSAMRTVERSVRRKREEERGRERKREENERRRKRRGEGLCGALL